MRTAGALLVFIGVVVGIYAFFMETSVTTDTGADNLPQNKKEFPDRIVNLDLMNRKQNTLFVAGIMCVVGAIFLGAAYVADSVRNRHQAIEVKSLPDKVEQGSGDSQQPLHRNISGSQEASLNALNKLIKKEAQKIFSGENPEITDLLKRLILDKDQFFVLNEEYKMLFNKEIIEHLTSISSNYAIKYYYVEPLIELGICKKEFPHDFV